ncbi:DnaJ domain-containing protein [Denitrificimonas caeni]|uniref:DnaJ domain-containing protein n=1 Tax=Denitrificimonas caeni TaxID=521720 RepID=UPI000413DB06|nr:DnaJ domain-containing protein [Denitrificimonas caeni]
MIWPLTIIGGLAGLAIASIPGGLLGMLLGSIVDRNLAFTSWAQLHARLQPKPAKLLDAQQTLFMLLGHLAKSTGRVSPEHIKMARVEMQRQQLFGAFQKTAIAAFSEGKDCRLAELRSSLRHHYRTPEQSERLLLAGWRMVLVEGLATAKQRTILQQCASWLGCSKAAFARYEELARPLRSSPPRQALNELDAALQLLGVRRTDSLAVIKTAYRRQLSLHHPDKMIGAGAKPAQVQAATEKTRALHNAYALLRKHR